MLICIEKDNKKYGILDTDDGKIEYVSEHKLKKAKYYLGSEQIYGFEPELEHSLFKFNYYTDLVSFIDRNGAESMITELFKLYKMYNIYSCNFIRFKNNLYYYFIYTKSRVYLIEGIGGRYIYTDLDYVTALENSTRLKYRMLLGNNYNIIKNEYVLKSTDNLIMNDKITYIYNSFDNLVIDTLVLNENTKFKIVCNSQLKRQGSILVKKLVLKSNDIETIKNLLYCISYRDLESISSNKCAVPYFIRNLDYYEGQVKVELLDDKYADSVIEDCFYRNRDYRNQAKKVMSKYNNYILMGDVYCTDPFQYYTTIKSYSNLFSKATQLDYKLDYELLDTTSYIQDILKKYDDYDKYKIYFYDNIYYNPSRKNKICDYISTHMQDYLKKIANFRKKYVKNKEVDIEIAHKFDVRVSITGLLESLLDFDLAHDKTSFVIRDIDRFSLILEDLLFAKNILSQYPMTRIEFVERLGQIHITVLNSQTEALKLEKKLRRYTDKISIRGVD